MNDDNHYKPKNLYKSKDSILDNLTEDPMPFKSNIEHFTLESAISNLQEISDFSDLNTLHDIINEELDIAKKYFYNQ